MEREALLDACTYVSKLNELPVIEFPLQSRNRFIAMEYMDAIPVPGDFGITAQSILFFEEIDIDSLHTLNNAFGLCFSAEEFFIGKYTMVEREISLVLNAWKKSRLCVGREGNFWKLYGKFERI
ncbi:hypothetical protein KUH03_15230 [Sphingobacterium sp. E70]|uniref:hypothetical protein n=1 Tax=Sphingobacterium sp. E70 TaxID=2853439 RepID=UPI00211BF1BF|nr:hypothetical protein [Sphingobacterium sp. E70]ULT27863.1 hypothetical protein KUH03_15230 [Sphingobacterium sp. E70]